MQERSPYLGFPVQVLGRDGVKSHDGRRWTSDPHLSLSLSYLRVLFAYLSETDIRLYRMASGLAPYATHPEMPRFHGQVAECADELADVGAEAQRTGLRLSFHPSQFIVLNALDDDLAARSRADIEVQAAILEAMSLGDEAVIVLHVGGVYGDRQAALERFARRYGELSPVARRRLVLEHDDARFGVADALWLHRRLGLRVVFDAHHFHCHNPDGLDMLEAAHACLATWEGWDARPKIHFSSPRTDWGFRHGSGEKGRRPDWKAHAEFVDPFAFVAFYRALLGSGRWGRLELARMPDVLLEAKAKDIAVTQLRQDLVRYAPDLAAVFGLGGNGEGQDGARVRTLHGGENRV